MSKNKSFEYRNVALSATLLPENPVTFIVPPPEYYHSKAKKKDTEASQPDWSFSMSKKEMEGWI